MTSASKTGDRSPAVVPKDAAPPPRPRSFVRRLATWIEHFCAAAFLLGLLLFISPVPGWIHCSFDRANELRHGAYVICLGGNMERVVEAARLVRDGVAEKLIVSNHGEAARLMRDIALEWGAPADRLLVDDQSRRTADHPAGAARLGVDPEKDVCIIVTDYAHLARSEAVFQKAGYKHVIMREPRWDRQVRERMPQGGGLMWRWLEMPTIVYESAAWVRYWIAGNV